MVTGIATGIRDFLSSRRNMNPSFKNKALCMQWGLSERILQPVQSGFLLNSCSCLIAVVLLFLLGFSSLDFDSLVELNNILHS